MVCTLLAAMAAAGAWRTSIQTLEFQEAERDQRLAQHVTWWFQPASSRGGLPFGIIQNSSFEPVNAVFRLKYTVYQRYYEQDFEMGTIPPCTKATFSRQLWFDGSTPPWKADLIFRDTRSQVWVRDESGLLRQATAGEAATPKLDQLRSVVPEEDTYILGWAVVLGPAPGCGIT
ncbi:hypothetical protein ACIBH1_45770 [Nonomuraea sp. NPDC050663]|uniref:hypothetical protein n=1 Tax=Nonomuraea sp. NPDC050663 TaxID=3364370 RepID=UPI003794EADF